MSEHEVPQPSREARAALAATPGEELLRTFARLTHAIHDVGDHGALSQEQAAAKRVHVVDLRAQRSLIQGELLRRMGEA